MSTILVVKENLRARQFFQAILEKSGHTVLAAENGEDALRVCHTHQEEIDRLIVNLIPALGQLNIELTAIADKILGRYA